MAIDDVIARAAFAAFKSDYIQHGERTAEKDWARFKGTGYHRRWLLITRAMLGSFLADADETVAELIVPELDYGNPHKIDVANNILAALEDNFSDKVTADE